MCDHGNDCRVVSHGEKMVSESSSQHRNMTHKIPLITAAVPSSINKTSLQQFFFLKKKRADDTFPMRLRGGLSLHFLLLIFGWGICCTAVGGVPPPPTITLTSSTDDTLVISVVPTTYGITRHDILQVASSQVSPLKQLAITGGAADPPRSSNFLPSSCYDGIITTECATNFYGVGRWISFDFAAATLRQVKITKHSTASNHIKLTNFDMEYQDENGGWSDCPGTPYSFPVSDGQGPLTFACLTPVKNSSADSTNTEQRSSARHASCIFLLPTATPSSENNHDTGTTHELRYSFSMICTML